MTKKVIGKIFGKNIVQGGENPENTLTKDEILYVNDRNGIVLKTSDPTNIVEIPNKLSVLEQYKCVLKESGSDDLLDQYDWVSHRDTLDSLRAGLYINMYFDNIVDLLEAINTNNIYVIDTEFSSGTTTYKLKQLFENPCSYTIVKYSNTLNTDSLNIEDTLPFKNDVYIIDIEDDGMDITTIYDDVLHNFIMLYPVQKDSKK